MVVRSGTCWHCWVRSTAANLFSCPHAGVSYLACKYMQAKVAFDVLHPTCFPADMQVVPIWHASMRAKAWPGALSKHAQKQTPERTLKTNIYIYIYTHTYNYIHIIYPQISWSCSQISPLPQGLHHRDGALVLRAQRQGRSRSWRGRSLVPTNPLGCHLALNWAWWLATCLEKMAVSTGKMLITIKSGGKPFSDKPIDVMNIY